jgi:hypothetical protein
MVALAEVHGGAEQGIHGTHDNPAALNTECYQQRLIAPFWAALPHRTLKAS